MTDCKHIHLKGLVQGVGFRPHVYALATQLQLNGYVNNSPDGVHIVVAGPRKQVEQFLQQLQSHPPRHAVITQAEVRDIPLQPFDHFSITESENHLTPDLLLTPDLAMCELCRQELFDENNRRYHYPFITCIHCGPRYSITTALPYDRCNTTMDAFEQCRHCKQEYLHPDNRRYFSQTNSCDECGISLQLFETGNDFLSLETDEILTTINAALQDGKIVAVKGIGGFLLMCDAGNATAIATLRKRKHRPSKPLALLYPDLDKLRTHVHLTPAEEEMLLDSRAPIVLCTPTENAGESLALASISPGLNRIGVMLPYAPLLALVADRFGRPLVATSGNVSGAPIIYENQVALNALSPVADLILLHNRDIVTPQDDSVVQFSAKHQQFIMLRRSRGWAPGYYPNTLPDINEKILATGGELKGSFALQFGNKCYVSQYLGDQSYFEAQESYQHTLQHLSHLLKFEPDHILIDKHPAYEVSAYGKQLSHIKAASLHKMQHHEAHVAAVLAENNLLQHEHPILGLAWDGTGYGNDGAIWGSEAFIYHFGSFNRVAHLDYFPILMGDKMSKEPRLSAMSLIHHRDDVAEWLEHKFDASSWKLYKNALTQLDMPKTSSMGRLLDGIASLLDLIDVSRYEGHAAMLLQAAAEKCVTAASAYPMPIADDRIQWQPMVDAIIEDLKAGTPTETIAKAVHQSLAQLAIQLGELHHT
ncbi:MAG TPA: carbamoyltransferase HypF, partial [Phnomibacter sp.]|nr:carbamoyltransferase HypF [Phnomibacter sp.]